MKEVERLKVRRDIVLRLTGRDEAKVRQGGQTDSKTNRTEGQSNMKKKKLFKTF